MTKFVGTKLQDPAMSVEKALVLVVDDVFSPHTSGIREEIVSLLLQAEEAYFEKIAPVAGEFDFEPLMGENAGPPIYLDRLSLAGLQTYQQDLYRWRDDFARIAPEVGKTELAARVITCTNNVLLDIAEQLQKRA
jgi:hypothetical protein